MIEDAVYQDLSTQLGKVASAIEKIFENQLNFGSLYEEIIKMDEYEETMLASAFDQLNEDEIKLDHSCWKLTSFVDNGGRTSLTTIYVNFDYVSAFY